MLREQSRVRITLAIVITNSIIEICSQSAAARMAGQLHLYVGQCVGVGKQLHALPSHPTLCELQLRYA